MNKINIPKIKLLDNLREESAREFKKFLEQHGYKIPFEEVTIRTKYV